MVDLSIQTVPHLLTSTSESHPSTVVVNNTIPDQLPSNALPHDECDLSGLFPNQHKLEALTPVYASSLYWLI